ncbi:Asr1405/Asl0597 family protein [Vacuolonema iberomarrocanum]|uniref:Asr1405/Asl0597 family protein n=1 Tax=Vacuolonema iberomarrocanum TaxID=3454632 RepID=UPI0019E86FEC|nr:hypothetical protein [filamentous cyanobacterium LEGE 07170]
MNPSLKPSPASACPAQSITVPPGVRWCLRHRLQELDICATCPKDGTLRVEIPHPVALVQLWSVVQQATTSRQEKLRWLERCWQLCPPHLADS